MSISPSPSTSPALDMPNPAPSLRFRGPLVSDAEAGPDLEQFARIGGAIQPPDRGELAGVIGAALTAIYILRLIGRTFYGDRDKQWDDITDLGPRELIAATILLIPIFFVGLYPQPMLRVIRPGVDAILAGLGS